MEFNRALQCNGWRDSPKTRITGNGEGVNCGRGFERSLAHILASSPLVGQKLGGDDIGEEGNAAVDGGQGEDHVAVDPEGLIEECCGIMLR